MHTTVIDKLHPGNSDGSGSPPFVALATLETVGLRVLVVVVLRVVVVGIAVRDLVGVVVSVVRIVLRLWL